MNDQRPRDRLLFITNLVAGVISLLGYTGHALIWFSEVYARNTYPPASFSVWMIGYYCASQALALLLLLTSVGFWDHERWARWASYFYCGATFLLQIALVSLGVLLAPDRPDWPWVLVVGLVLSDIYAGILLVLLVFV